MKVEFELTYAVFKKWMKYKKKKGFRHDSSALHNLLEKTISDKDLLDALYESASCIIPSEKLTEEQKDNLDNIMYFFCGCELCKKAAAHANIRSHQIGISRRHFNKTLKSGCLASIRLIDSIVILLHEITHILYPHLDEDEVKQKTAELWTEGIGKIAHRVEGLLKTS